MFRKVPILFTVLLIASLVFFSCTIKKHDEADKAKAKDGIEIYFGNTGFDAKQYVAEIWDAKVLPYVQLKAKPLDILMAGLETDAARFSKECGYRVGEEGTFYNFAVQGRVTLVGINQESRNGLVYAKSCSNPDGKEYVFQIGPVFKGTSLRDILDFISLNDFENQVEFARLANELNFKVRDDVLGGLSFEDLVGSEVDVTAVFTFDPTNQVHVMTPVVFTLLDKEGLTHGE